MILATLLCCAALQAAPQTPPPAQPRYPVDAATGRAIGATEMAPEAVRTAIDEGRRMVIIDTRPAEAFEKETLPTSVFCPIRTWKEKSLTTEPGKKK